MTTEARLRMWCAAAMSAIAGIEFAGVFGRGAVVTRVAVSVLFALVAAWLAASQGTDRSAPRATFSLALVGVVVAVALLAAPGTAFLPGVPSTATIRVLVDGLLHGPGRILGSTLPAPARPDLLVVPVVATFLLAIWSIRCSLGRRPLAAVGPAVGLFTLAAVLGGKQAGAPYWPVAVFLLAVGGLAAASRAEAIPVLHLAGPSGTRHQRTQARALASAVMALTVLSGVVMGPRLPLAQARDPYTARRTPPGKPIEVVDPMSMVAFWADDAAPELFRTSSSQNVRTRLAVLERYDPSQGWTASTAFRPAGTKLPARGDGSTIPVAMQVTISGLSGVWLPVAGWPTRLEGLRGLLDPASGTLMTSAPLQPSVRYVVVGEVPRRSADCTLASVGRASSDGLGIPSDIAALAARLTQGATSPCERADRLRAFLEGPEFHFDANAPPGNTLLTLRSFLFNPVTGGRGTSEQFAAAFALLGRAAGLPTRVTVGFAPGEDIGGGVRVVHAGDASAWPEVQFNSIGWVPFDLRPSRADGGARPSPLQDEPPRQDPTTAQSTPPVREGAETPTTIKSGERSSPHRLPWRLWAWTAAVLSPLIVPVVVAANRRRREERRRRGDARTRVVGAWRHALDSLVDHGVGWDPTLSARQYVEQCERAVGQRAAEVLAVVGELVNAARFGPDSPSEDEVAAAWSASEQASLLARAQLTWWRRLVRLVDVRSLSERAAAGAVRTVR